ncbi:MAG: hypothetical protein GKS02_04610 [Alphaproteobacteria bacterium]|nr:hypothetical protein [Alphaproteobacteria bacterium]
MSHTDAQTADKNADSRPFNEAERTRFHNLLKLAAESPFDGERAAALAAAMRLAKRHGMTLDEAASGGPVPELPKKRDVERKGPHHKQARDLGRHIHMMDNWVSNDKARRDAALAEAYERGLDSDARKRGSVQAPRRKGSKRNPQSHAKVLLQETSMPMLEICALTGLDIYEVVGLKLKLRTPNSR